MPKPLATHNVGVSPKKEVSETFGIGVIFYGAPKENLFGGNEIYLEGTMLISRERNVFRGNEMYFEGYVNT